MRNQHVGIIKLNANKIRWILQWMRLYYMLCYVWTESTTAKKLCLQDPTQASLSQARPWVAIARLIAIPSAGLPALRLCLALPGR